MVKQRFSSLDIRCVVSGLQDLVNSRVSNIYDLQDKRTYLFKFAKSGVAEKTFVLFESGVRLHKTIYKREAPQIPSIFGKRI